MRVSLAFALAVALCAHKCTHARLGGHRLATLRAAPRYAIARGGQTALRPLSILFDTNDIDAARVGVVHKQWIKATILPRLAEWVAELLQVNGPTTVPALSRDVCFGYVPVPPRYLAATTETDLLVFVSSMNRPSEDFVAQATACAQGGDGRPIVGFIQFNEAYMKNDETDLRVAMHELLHVLGVSPWLFESFLNAPPAGATYCLGAFCYLQTPAAVAFLRAHLDCPIAMAVPLEDEGGDGSVGAHFEQVVVASEMMTAQVGDEMALSGLTLAVLADSGWYKVAAERGEELRSNRGGGCDALRQACSPRAPDFCGRAGEVGCSSDYLGGSVCRRTFFSNNCLIRLPSYTLACDQLNPVATAALTAAERNGPTSRCFAMPRAPASRPFGCFPSNCRADGSVELTIGGQSALCTQNGQILNVGGIVVQCPDIARFCAFRRARACPRDCDGHGQCRLDGSCKCRIGFSPPNCAIL